jgi:hypothetical protein
LESLDLITAGSRIREQETQAKTDRPRPYQVDRWRYTYQHSANTDSGRVSTQADEPHGTATAFALSSRRKEHCSTSAGERDTKAWLDVLVEACHFNPSPTQDHLLHLIHVNVVRGLFDNKVVLLGHTSYLANGDGAEGLQPIPAEQAFPGRAAIMSTASDLPGSLRPTRLQNTVIHATCIDLIPFPSIRDNLIQREGLFSWAEFVEDLVGHLLDPSCFFGPQGGQKQISAAESAPYYGEEDDFSANRNGIIVWGAPHRPESWEVTSGFLRKWGWTLKGCHDIIESTNCWRISRGEEPLMRSA